MFLVIIMLLVAVFLHFFTFMMEKDRKTLFLRQKMISTSEQHAEHLFTGQNAQLKAISSKRMS